MVVDCTFRPGVYTDRCGIARLLLAAPTPSGLSVFGCRPVMCPPPELSLVIGFIPVPSPLPELRVFGCRPVSSLLPELPVGVALVPVAPAPSGFLPVAGCLPVTAAPPDGAVLVGRTPGVLPPGVAALLRGGAGVAACAGRAGLAAGCACREGAAVSFCLDLLFWAPANGGTRSSANRHVNRCFIILLIKLA